MKKNPKKDLVAYVVRSPRTLIEKLEVYVYTDKIKSRNALVNSALQEWLNRKIKKNKNQKCRQRVLNLRKKGDQCPG